MLTTLSSDTTSSPSNKVLSWGGFSALFAKGGSISTIGKEMGDAISEVVWGALITIKDCFEDSIEECRVYDLTMRYKRGPLRSYAFLVKTAELDRQCIQGKDAAAVFNRHINQCTKEGEYHEAFYLSLLRDFHSSSIAATSSSSSEKKEETSAVSSSSFANSSTSSLTVSVVPASKEANTIMKFVYTSELFCNSDDKMRDVIKLDKIASSKDTPKELETLVKLLNTSSMDWTHKLFSCTHIEELVVLAHIKEKISLDQLATAFYRLSTIDRHAGFKIPVKHLSISNDDGTTNKEVKELIKQTLSLLLNNSEKAKNILTDEEFDLLISDIKKLPPSEQGILVAQQFVRFVGSRTPQTIMEAVVHFTGVNLFNQISYQGQKYRMYPSFGMVLTALKIFKSTVEPLICFNSRSITETARQDKRPITLQSKIFGKPINEADFYLAEGDDFTSHDFYHILVMSKIPKRHRELHLEFAAYMRKYGVDSKHPEYYVALAGKLEDMDCPEYFYLDERKAFWVSFANTLHAVKTLISSFSAMSKPLYRSSEVLKSFVSIDFSKSYEEIEKDSLPLEKALISLSSTVKALELDQDLTKHMFAFKDTPQAKFNYLLDIREKISQRPLRTTADYR